MRIVVAVARIFSTDGPVIKKEALWWSGLWWKLDKEPNRLSGAGFRPFLPLCSLAWRASFCSTSQRKSKRRHVYPQFGGIPADVNACDAVGMHADTVQFLREHAQTCTRLARDCPDRPTAHGLEEVAISLAAKAEELEREFELRS